MKSTRRTFLRGVLGAAGLGLALGDSAGATPPMRRLLIVAAQGGMRTTMAFNASAQMALNPWGVLSGLSGGRRFGKVLAAQSSTTTLATPSWPGSPAVPDIVQIASKLAIIGAVDHAPFAYRTGDHYDDATRMGTGFLDPSAAGILTLANKYRDPAAPLPACVVGEFGVLAGGICQATGDWLAHAPLPLQADAMPGAEAAQGGVDAVLEDVIDLRQRSRLRGIARGRLEAYANRKRSLRTYGPMLALPALRLADPSVVDEAAFDGISNRMLLEAAGNPIDAKTVGPVDGINVALSIRLLQLGAPAVLLIIDGFDTHSDEEQVAPDLYARFARYLAGVHFALSRIPSGAGTLLDETLVVTMSDFGRSPGPDSGYATQNGTDHGFDVSWRHQAHVLFGGGVSAHVLAPTDDDNVPVDGAPISTQALLAAIASHSGLPGDAVADRWPIGTDLYPSKDQDALESLWS